MEEIQEQGRGGVPAGRARELPGVRRPRTRLGREQERADAEPEGRAAREHDSEFGGRAAGVVHPPPGGVAVAGRQTTRSNTAAMTGPNPQSSRRNEPESPPLTTGSMMWRSNLSGRENKLLPHTQ